MDMSGSSKGVAPYKDASFFDLEYANVLTQYLSLFNEDSRQFNVFIAPNGMLDWFGRVHVGPQKIHNFLRLVVCTECEHLNFNKAEKCDPIERKPSHERTKLVPNDSDYAKTFNRLNRGASLKLYADSDIEEEDVSMVPLPEDNQIPMINKDLTKISNAYETPDTDDDSDAEMESKAKRMKHSHSPFHYLRRWSLSKDRGLVDEDDSSTSSNDADMSDASSTEKEKPLYTVLQYFESSGILRKHRNSLGHEDRRVRIRISYRTRIPSQDLQIALIMYEDLDRNMTLIRRKLTFDWVQETAPQEARVESLINDDFDSNDVIDREQPPHSHVLPVNELDDEVTSMVSEEQPALVRNGSEEMVAATVETPTTEEIAAALESAAFTIVPFGTPTKLMRTPPSTPKRQPRVRHTAPNMKRSQLSSDSASTSSSATKRGAARCLRL